MAAPGPAHCSRLAYRVDEQVSDGGGLGQEYDSGRERPGGCKGIESQSRRVLGKNPFQALDQIWPWGFPQQRENDRMQAVGGMMVGKMSGPFAIKTGVPFPIAARAQDEAT